MIPQKDCATGKRAMIRVLSRTNKCSGARLCSRYYVEDYAASTHQAYPPFSCRGKGRFPTSLLTHTLVPHQYNRSYIFDVYLGCRRLYL